MDIKADVICSTEVVLNFWSSIDDIKVDVCSLLSLTDLVVRFRSAISIDGWWNIFIPRILALSWICNDFCDSSSSSSRSSTITSSKLSSTMILEDITDVVLLNTKILALTALTDSTAEWEELGNCAWLVFFKVRLLLGLAMVTGLTAPFVETGIIIMLLLPVGDPVPDARDKVAGLGLKLLLPAAGDPKEAGVVLAIEVLITLGALRNTVAPALNVEITELLFDRLTGTTLLVLVLKTTPEGKLLARPPSDVVVVKVVFPHVERAELATIVLTLLVLVLQLKTIVISRLETAVCGAPLVVISTGVESVHSLLSINICCGSCGCGEYPTNFCISNGVPELAFFALLGNVLLPCIEFAVT
ncbi:hypothetical protein GQX74_010239 [Glossina fuscipes]|nr:hypothetical protein GQX74_010239 [Glossina fuscipes]